MLSGVLKFIRMDDSLQRYIIMSSSSLRYLSMEILSFHMRHHGIKLAQQASQAAHVQKNFFSFEMNTTTTPTHFCRIWEYRATFPSFTGGPSCRTWIIWQCARAIIRARAQMNASYIVLMSSLNQHKNFNEVVPRIGAKHLRKKLFAFC